MRFTEAICIELTPQESDALLLILNESREKLSLPVENDVYRELLRKLGTIHAEKRQQDSSEISR